MQGLIAARFAVFAAGVMLVIGIVALTRGLTAQPPKQDPCPPAPLDGSIEQRSP